MLNRQIDYALVGHNFYALLMSIGLLQKGNKVLVLDDDRFNYGEFFTNSLTLLDVALLKQWGEKVQCAPLINLDDYLESGNLTFNVGKTQIHLGREPHKNFRELCRKFPQTFLSQNFDLGFFKNDKATLDFDLEYFDFCQKISLSLFNSKKTFDFTSTFDLVLPAKLKDNFNFFFKQFGQSTEGQSPLDLADFHSLIYMMRGFFQSRLSKTGSKTELFHLFISLISPYYKLDHERLVRDLLEIHQNLGGDFKKMNLADLKFQSGLVKSFELESFDGIIKPNKMCFIGGYPVGLPIKLKTGASRSYQCLHIEMSFKDQIPPLLNFQKCIFTSPIKVGTDRPFWEVYFNDKMAIFNVIISKKEGSKISFIHQQMENVILEDLKFLYPEYEWNVENTKMNFTLDVFLEDKNFKAHKKLKMPFTKKIVDVVEDTTPQFMSKLKNVVYFGPYNEDSLGTFSSLVEMKKWSDSL